MSSSEFPSFFQKFGVDIDNPPTDFNYRKCVLGDQVETFPFQVARILNIPRGPTSAQDGLVGVIVPYILEDDLNSVMSFVTDRTLPSRSFDMNTGDALQHTPETLVVNPEGFVNSVLLACLHYLKEGKEDIAHKMMQYVKQILPYVGSAGIWTLSPQDPTQTFSVVGNIKTLEQLENPYKHQEVLFPNTLSVGTQLS